MTRLDQQLAFIMEMDRLKAVVRRNRTPSADRYENTAEHSWHIALMGLILVEQSPQDVDVLTVVTMLMLHDIVEIDAGDTFAYDEGGHDDKEEREREAADRLFGLLPDDQRDKLRAIWDEFEAGETGEALLARALDRLQPILLNHRAGRTSSWAEHGIRRQQVLDRNDEVRRVSPALWAHLLHICDEAVEAGHLLP